MFSNVNIATLINLGGIIAFASMVTMFTLAETACGTQPLSWGSPPLGQVRVLG
jgi:hypothetical protein